MSHKCKDEDIDVLALPGCQGKLVNAVANTSSKAVLVLMNGGPHAKLRSGRLCKW